MQIRLLDGTFTELLVTKNFGFAESSPCVNSIFEYDGFLKRTAAGWSGNCATLANEPASLSGIDDQTCYRWTQFAADRRLDGTRD